MISPADGGSGGQAASTTKCITVVKSLTTIPGLCSATKAGISTLFCRISRSMKTSSIHRLTLPRIVSLWKLPTTPGSMATTVQYRHLSAPGDHHQKMPGSKPVRALESEFQWIHGAATTSVYSTVSARSIEGMVLLTELEATQRQVIFSQMRIDLIFTF